MIDANEFNLWLSTAEGETIEWRPDTLAQGLDNPIGFPPFAKALVPGDTIAIAVAPNVPSPAHLLNLLVLKLLGYGIEPDRIWIVLGLDNPRLVASVQKVVCPLGISEDHVAAHDPKDQTRLEFLAADEDAEAIYVNRHLLDADILLPIVPLRPAGSSGDFGIYGIVPWFLDIHSQRRIRLRALDNTTEGLENRVNFGNWIGQLCGVSIIIGLLPGPDLSKCTLVVGSPIPLSDLSKSSLISVINFGIGKENLDWIVGHIGGPGPHQSWDELSQVIADLATHLKQDGTLVVCSQLSRRPNGALRLLAGIDDEELTESKLLKSELPHALAALQLLNAIKRVHVYMTSELPNEEVESLGLVALKSSEEIPKLIRNSNHGLMISQAQYCIVPIQA